MKNLSNKALGNLLVTIPDVNEQESILNRMDDLNIEVGRLELIYRQKLNSLKELKQSLLQKAFSGELTVEDNVLKEEAVA